MTNGDGSVKVAAAAPHHQSVPRLLTNYLIILWPELVPTLAVMMGTVLDLNASTISTGVQCTGLGFTCVMIVITFPKTIIMSRSMRMGIIMIVIS